MKKIKEFVSVVMAVLVLMQALPLSASGAVNINQSTFKENLSAQVSSIFTASDVSDEPTPTATPEPTATLEPTPTATLEPTPTATLEPTATPTFAKIDITIEGYIKPDFDFSEQQAGLLRSGFKVEIVGASNSALTDESGHFIISLNDDTDYRPYMGLKLRISKEGYLTREYGRNIGILGHIVIGTSDSPEVIWAGDLPIRPSNTDDPVTPPDNAISMKDMMEVLKSFDTSIGDENYLAIRDLNKDGIVNETDVSIVAKHINTNNSKYPQSVNSILLAGDSVSTNLNLENTSLDLGGKLLQVNGALTFRSISGSTLKLNAGRLEVMTDLIFGAPVDPDNPGSPVQNPKLIMNNDADIVRVGGNLIYSTAANHEGLLTAGKIELYGDFTIHEVSNEKAFFPTGTHKVALLKTDGVQTVSLGNAPNSLNKINILVLSRPNIPSNYVFYPDPCWESLEFIN